MIISTITSAANLPGAILMAKSAKRHMPNVKTMVCLVEEHMHPAAADCESFDAAVLAKDIGFHDFYRHMFKFTQLQCAAAVKGQLFRYLLQAYSNENEFVYLDADMYVMGPFDELSELLSRCTIVLTPHYLEPSEARNASREIDALKYGTFHGGLVAVRRTEGAGSFINGWADFIASNYKDPYKGLFLDQKWFNFAPSFFDVMVMKHPGYNVGFWNLHEKNRQIRRDSSGRCMINSNPLCCFHFSNLGGQLDSGLRNWAPNQEAPIRKLIQEYRNELDELGMSDITRQPWSYDYYHNGENIWEEARTRYKEHEELHYKFDNPFAASNGAFIASGDGNERKVKSEVRPVTKLEKKRRKKRKIRKFNGKRKEQAAKKSKIGRTTRKKTAVKARRSIGMKRRKAVKKKRSSLGSARRRSAVKRKPSPIRTALRKK